MSNQTIIKITDMSDDDELYYIISVESKKVKKIQEIVESFNAIYNNDQALTTELATLLGIDADEMHEINTESDRFNDYYNVQELKKVLLKLGAKIIFDCNALDDLLEIEF